MTDNEALMIFLDFLSTSNTEADVRIFLIDRGFSWREAIDIAERGARLFNEWKAEKLKGFDGL